MKTKNGYLLILFLALFLFINLAQAEPEYGVCFYPSTYKAEFTFRWRSDTNNGAHNQKSRVDFTIIDLGKFPNPKSDVTQVPDAYIERENAYKLEGSTINVIKITWEDGNTMEADFNAGSPNSKKAKIKYNGLESDKVQCIRDHTTSGLAKKEAVRIAYDATKAACTHPATLTALGLGVSAVALICYGTQ